MTIDTSASAIPRHDRSADRQRKTFKFTGPAKQQLMEGLAVAIQQREITVPAGPLVSELETFEYVYTRTGVTYSAPDGLHDDCVCALALAVRHRRSHAVGAVDVAVDPPGAAPARPSRRLFGAERPSARLFPR